MNKIITYSFICFIVIFSVLQITTKDLEISYSERRKLNTFPKFSLDSKYITKLDNYFLDHFPIRDTFRSIKAFYNYKILNKLDNNGIYLKDNYIFKSNYPTNYNSINNFINKIEKLKENTSNNFHIMIVPDKNYYLDTKEFIKIDYDYIFDSINKLNINNIDIKDIMKLEDYYETDTHWKQENLDKVIKELSKNLNFDYKDISYKENTFDNFYGVYYGESALKRNPEKITYLYNDIIESASVYYLENNKIDKVYNLDNLLDTYEIYLDGASSYIEITNNKCLDNKELVIFRDSFGSSITPLLIPYYKKITVIDNRYISSDNYSKYIDLNNKDILFIYSTLLVNDSFTLKG